MNRRHFIFAAVALFIGRRATADPRLTYRDEWRYPPGQWRVKDGAWTKGPGMYFTPPNIMALVEPACGSGAFLAGLGQ